MKSKATDRCCELGGGANPQVRPNFDVRMVAGPDGQQAVDAVIDFNVYPLPLQSEEWDGIFSQYALEHISWRNIPQFLKEVYRITKPGGKVVFITANTEAQINWAASHPEGWDNQDFYTSISQLLFGDNDYPENTHRVVFSPEVLKRLFEQAGFEQLKLTPYGARDTDVCVEAVRAVGSGGAGQTYGSLLKDVGHGIDKNALRKLLGLAPLPEFAGQNAPVSAEQIAELLGVGAAPQPQAPVVTTQEKVPFFLQGRK